MARPSSNDTPRKGWVLSAMSLGFTMTMIDATIVAVALPTIQRELDMSSAERAWVVNAYLLVLAVSIAAAGKLGDLIGSRRVFLVGLGIFTVMSATCGFAVGAVMLLAARAVQGFGSALMTPTSQSVVTHTYGEEERGRALGIYAGVSAAGIALGPILGGALTMFVDWRAIFFVNVPVGIATYALTRYARPGEARGEKGRLDWLGLGLLVAGLSAVVIALMEAGTWGGMSSPEFLIVLGVGIVLLVAFVVVELRLHEPLLQLRIFRDRNFTGDNIVMFLMRFALFGMSVYAPIFTQDVLGFSPFEAGLASLPATIALFLTSPRAGKLYDRLGARPLLGAGTLIAASGFAIFALLAFPNQSYAWMVPAFVLAGVGVGLIQSPALTDAMNAAPARQQGEAAGILGTTQQVGGTIGIAVMTAVITPLFLRFAVDNLGDIGIETTESELQERLLAESANGSLPSGVTTQQVDAFKDAFSSAMSIAYLVIVALLLVAFVVTLVFIRKLDRRSDQGPAVAV